MKVLPLIAAVLLSLSPAAVSSSWAGSARALIRPSGASASESFGLSVSGAGDVNGDGYADVIVGARLNDAGGPDAGRAYLYYGGPAADANADLVLTGEGAGDLLGSSVSDAGDVNGDGYADVIVGAQWNDAGGLDAGRAYVYYGGPGMDAIADLTLTGEGAGDSFGASVSGVGDLNGDGYADIMVGAYGNDAGLFGSNVGRAYGYYGGPGVDANADLILTGGGEFDLFGGSISGAGDVNGDGYDDVIISARLGGPGGDAGRASVYYGGPGMDGVADLLMGGEASGDNFGSVSDAGDVNGDGYADVIVGAAGNDAGGSDAGRAYVYYGGPGVDPIADLVLTGAAPGDRFGSSVSSAGDLNGDGVGDWIVGAIWNDAAGSNAGRAYVYYGAAGLDSIADLILTGEASNDNFGSVSSAGDLNGDGYADVIVGASGNDGGGMGSGRAYVYTARPYEVLSPNGMEQWVGGLEQRVRWQGTDPADLWISLDGGVTYSLLASGTGRRETNELTVVAPTVPTPGGRIRVSVSGEPVSSFNSDASDGVFSIVMAARPPGAAARLDRVLTGAAAGDELGNPVAGTGDVNGDGYADVIVGAYASDAGGADAGRAYVHYGGPAGDAVPDLTLTGAAAGDYLGSAVSGAGDVNGDGYADLVVGAYVSDAGGLDAGRVYVYHGGPAADAVADLTFTGAAAGDLLGFSVAGAGDVNGDGHADVILGAPSNDAGGTDAGRAYVFYGGPGADAVADLTFTGESAGDNLGISVSGAGDVNGDGHDDLLVGASGADAGGVNAGRAYVFHGGPGAEASADVVLTGAAPGDLFGRSVSGAGDANGDGSDDVLVGAHQSDAGGTDAGRAYLFYGGARMDSAPDLTLSGEGADDSFGYSVTGAGDANGDGFRDLAVGAWGNDAGGPDAGRVYLYFGGPGMDSLADLVLTGTAAGDLFGISVSSAGDTKGDGHADLIVGSSLSDAGGMDAGRATIHDMNRYHLLSPNGGETWNVGAPRSIAWTGPEPADLWLSVDGGRSYDLLVRSVGGAVSNTWPLRVPHAPSKFAQIRVTPTGLDVAGSDRSDSLFTIQTSVALLSLLASSLPEGGVELTWATDPGPADLRGYRVERAGGASAWQTLAPLVTETRYVDASGGPGTRYRVSAVNGFGEELWLGETSIRSREALAAWPLPYRGGALTVSFATAGGLGGGDGGAEVSIFDVQGRLVKRLARGSYPQGHRTVVWDGRDALGRETASGIYFIRLVSGGERRTLRLSVLR